MSGKKSGGDHPRRHQHGLLSEDDERLWNHTADSIEPLRKGQQRVLQHDPMTDETGHAGLTPAPPQLRHPLRVVTEGKSGGSKGQSTRRSSPQQPPPAQPETPSLAPFNQRAARHLRSGRRRIEARIDLHGMRQNEAHAALRRFLVSQQGRGAKWVLVITGHGGRSRADEDNEVGYFTRQERGVLRRNVPRWLAEPELRSIVVSFQPAAVQHGGDGALYVELRSRSR